ncbi:MAG: DUF1566 domain-containing protein [Desulfatibacillaceae bacterium]
MYEVAKTDQTACYDARGKEVDCAGTGQDAAHNAGKDWPGPRFGTRGDTVLDGLTGLVWTLEAGLGGFPLTHDEALQEVARMAGDRAHGYDDWRLPSRRELFSLVSHVNVNPALPDGAPFQEVFPGYYWTATPVARLPREAWYVHLGGARVFKGMRYGSYMVWPVRGEGLPETTEGPRWEPVAGDSARDLLTDLVWRDMGCGPVDWAEALDRVAQWNRDNPDSGAWRLPNIRELESVCDTSTHSPAIGKGHPFTHVMPGCWSSTTSVYEASYAWVLYPEDGALGVGHKPGREFCVWAVRDGQ